MNENVKYATSKWQHLTIGAQFSFFLLPLLLATRAALKGQTSIHLGPE